MENAIIFIILLSVSFVLGLYISSQIMEHIDGKTQQKKLMKNLRDFDRRDIMDKSENIELKNDGK